VRVHDLARLDEVLDVAVRAGGNEVQGIRFEIDDPSAALDRARAAAWKDAEHKAGQLAELTGAVLGDVTRIEASSRAPGQIVKEALGCEAVQAVPIESGLQIVEVSLIVEWILR
jgi:uncharacterized protein YggE